VKDTVLGVAIGGAIVWLGVLLLQNQNIKIRKQCAGEIQGIDWRWEDPAESGRSSLFSIPWTKNLRTGETERWNLKGERVWR
jgi:hypothetical protein